ncbi:MAG: sulfatase [Rhodospirillales bacterium]|nr:sulfatase [Rhodospirillales bacterium]
MRRRCFIGGIGGLAASATGAALLPTVSAFAAQPMARPNFLFMLSDDQNWDGLSVAMDPRIENSRSPVVETPSLAALAAQGMRFSQAYAPAPVCSPTRASLQTGKSPAQLRWTKAGPPVRGAKLLTPLSPRHLDGREITIAEILRAGGYATAHYGKWHLGGGGPEAHGYDESDGDTDNRHAAPFTAPNPVDIFGMGERAIDFMKRMRDTGQPFFVQMSYNALHFPQNALPETIRKYRRKMGGNNMRAISQAALAENLDTGIGQLLAELDRLGLAGNTYVIFMSDNGGDAGGKNRPLRGGKGALYEGGIRVPFIMRGPGIAPGSTCDLPVIGFDLLPTVMRLAGTSGVLPHGAEGGDFSHLLAGADDPVKRPREELVFHFPHYQAEAPHSALRLGDFKLIRFYENGGLALYDLSRDLGEKDDLAKSMPEKAAELNRRLEAHLAEVGAVLPMANPHYDPERAPSRQQWQGIPQRPRSGRRQRPRRN